ncbi:uncharacterized protein FYW61_014174 [Anableps anableps]
MCDCFHLAFPNWHAAPSGTAGRRLQAPEPAAQDDSICEEATQFAEGERPRPQGSSPVQEFPEAAKYTDGDKECEAEHDPDYKAGSGYKGKKSGLGSIFERTSTPKMSKSKEAHSPEGGVIVNTANDGCAEGLVYGGGGKEGIFIKKVVPESPASKSLKVKEGDQILSATVYFDNMSYEDAIQILEHAQAYKLKLCLKRQPDIMETEPTIDSDVIPEEEVCSIEMREQGKTRRRGDARISWPKFPSFGKGRKSRFTRSHSSSEADEQRKLELSPTTSDTESPIKSQDALKGKKKHKIKLSGLTKRGRISSSEDQDTDAPTTGQMSSDIQQKQESDTLSPEFPEYSIAETPEVNEQAGEAVDSGQIQDKVELISIDTSLKAADLTVALGDQESQSGTPKSPDERKKKKERSELKIKILGKDKLHKKEVKAKSSPKRLMTLGASVDAEDLPETEKSAAISSSESKTKLLGDQSTANVNSKVQSSESSKVISSKSITSQISLPKVELDISVRKSPKKGDEKTQKGKDMKQKQSKKSSPKHKQPEVDMSHIATSEEIQKVNDQGATTIAGRVSTTQLPKREDIEIPGMEDMSIKTTMETKADFKKRNKENKAETVQMSIDVDSVKEAVSKLPGFKLPQVDISGVPIPEEITVIDANAQRISVKTPTKVVKPKQEEHLMWSDITASSEISKTIFLTENRIDFKTSQKEDKTSPTKYKNEEETKEKEFDRTKGKGDLKTDSESAATKEPLKTSTRPKITMPSFGMSAKSRRLPYIGIDMQNASFIQEKELKTEIRKDERQSGEVICKVKIPELDGIEYIDSTDESSVNRDGGLTSFHMSTDVKTTTDISLGSKEKFDEPEDGKNKLSKHGVSETVIPSAKEDIFDESTTKPLDKDGKSTFKWPNLDISVPKLKGTTVDINTSKKDTVVTETQSKGGLIPGGPERDISLKSSDVYVPEEMGEEKKPQVEMKPVETEDEFDWETSKFATFGIKTPKIKGPELDLSLSKKDAHGKAEGPFPELSKKEVTPGKGNVYFLKQKMQLEKPGVEVKPLQTKGEHVQGGKIKMPKFGIKTTKLTGPEINISLSKKEAEFTLPKAKPEVKLTEGSETDVKKDIFRPEEKKEIENSDLKIKTLQKEGEEKGHGHKIKMPQVGTVLSKVTTHESDLSLLKKGKDLTLPEVKGEIKDLEIEGHGSLTKLDVRTPGIKVETKDVEGSSSKFKMSIDTIIPDTDVKTKTSEMNGKASKFKIPKFGISLPKLKGPETDTTPTQKVGDVDVPLLKGEAEVKLFDTEHEEPGIRLEGKAPQIGVQKDVEYPVSKPEITVPFSDAKTVKLSQADGEKINISTPVVLNEAPELEIQTLKAESQLDGQEGKIKLPKIGMKMPKIKGPEFHLGLSSKDVDGMKAKDKVDLLPDTETEVEIPLQTGDVSLGKAEILISTGKVEVGKPEVQTQPTIEGQGGRLKMPRLGITMPKVKGPETKKDVEGTLIESKTNVKIPDEDFEVQSVEQSPSKFNMPTFKLPKFGRDTPSVTTGVYTSDIHVQGDGIDTDIPDEVLAVTIVAPSIDLSNIDVDTNILESKTEVPLLNDDLNKYAIEVEAKTPQTKVLKKEKDGSSSKFKMPTFKLPKFGLSVQSSTEEVPPFDRDNKTGEGETTASGEILSVSTEGPSIDIKGPTIALKSTETEKEGRGRKFKLPSLGFSASQTKGPDTDISLPTTDVDVTVPEMKMEIKLPEEKFNKSFEVEAKAPEFKGTQIETEGSPSKFKMPTFKLPKFGISAQSSTEEVPPFDRDNKTGERETTASGEILSVGTKGPSIDIKGPAIALKTTEIEKEGRGRKFKLPSLGFSASQTKGPDTDISLPTTDVDVTVPEMKMEIKLPEEKFNKSFEVEVKAPEFKDTQIETEGSPSKFKMPTFKLPKFGLSVQSSTEEVPPFDRDNKTGEGETTASGEILAVSTEGPSIDIKGPTIALKSTETEKEGRGRKFKLPSLGFSASQTKGPDTDISLPTTDVDVTVPEMKMEIKLPEEKFNKSFEVEAIAPEFKGTQKETEGSPSKFKMPTFKLPKFGISAQSSTEEVPPFDRDNKTGERETTASGEILSVGTEGPSIDIKGPTIALKSTEIEKEGRGRKFKLPSLGFSASQTKGPDTDISLPTTDVDVTVPEMKMEIKLPEEKFNKSFEVEAKAPEFKGTQIETEGSPSKFKMPTFKLPKFGLSVQSSTEEVPPFDRDNKTGEGETTASGEILSVGTEGPSIDIKGPTIALKSTEIEKEGRGRKFKLPSLGFSASQTKGPDTDISLPTTDVDVTVPEMKMEIKLPEEKFNKSFEVEAKAPEFKGTQKETEGSPSKFKMPTFKLPKFGLSVQSSTEEVPPFDRDNKTGEGETTASGEILAVSTEGPSIDIKGPTIALKSTETEKEGRGRKFKLPSLGFSASQTKGPDTDISLPTTDVDVTVPEMKMEIKLPEEKFNKSFEVEAKAPEFKGTQIETEGSPSKFKMPTFKLPKFGISVQSSTEEVPPLDIDLKIAGGEATMSEKAVEVGTEGPSVELRGPNVESKKEGREHEGKGKKFKLPSLGFTATQAKGQDTDLRLRTDVDVTQPELKAEVKLPDDELKRIETEIQTKGPEIQVEAKDIEGSTSKFKMPTFKFPKFGLSTQSTTEEIPSFDKDVKIGGGETTALEEVLTVTTEGPSIEIEGTSVDLSTEGSEHEGRGRKFKLPSLSFSVPQTKAPETDLSLRTDVDVTLPTVKAEVKLPSDKLNKSVEVDTKALENRDIKKNTEGSPSKFKMPNFKLPKFGLTTQTSTGEVPPLDKGVKPVEGKITTSEEVIVVTTEAPTIEIKGPFLEPKTEGSDREEKGKKFKLPSLGFSVTEAKGAGSDLGLSTTEVDVTLPEVKAEVKLLDDDLKKTSTAIEIKGPEIKTVTKETDGSPSKFKMPAFKLPKFGLATQSLNKQGPALDKEVKTVKGESTTLEEVLTVTTEEPSIEIKGPSLDLKSSETDDERKGSKFKLPSLGFSLAQSKGADTNISLAKTDVDVTAPEVKAEVQFSDAKMKQPSVQMDIKSPEIKADVDTTSEVKMPKITLPKFGAVTPLVSVEIPDVNKEKRGDVDPHVDTEPVDVNAKDGERKTYEGKVEVQLPSAEAKGEDVPTVELEGKVKRLNWSFPSISFSRTGSKAPDVDVHMETPKGGVTSLETKISDADVKESSVVPAIEASPAPELDTSLKKSKFSLPRFSFSKSSMKEPEVKADLPDHGIKVEHDETELITEIKLSADEDKKVLTAFETTTSEAEIKSKKFKMPTLKMPRFGSASYEVTTETHSIDKTAEGDGSQLREGPMIIIKGQKIDVQIDTPKSEQPDHETLNTESDNTVHGSPSKFKLPTIKIPRLGLSKSKLEDESAHNEHENNEGQLEIKTELKEENLSPKLTLTPFGDILKTIDVDFDVRKVDKVDQPHVPVEPTMKHTEGEDKETKSTQDTAKSPESLRWFKFPKFGLSSPTEQQKIPDNAEQVKDSSPVGETKDEEVSPTFSVQSSDAFADISSTITSEPVGPFVPSPTKVTVKYSDERAAAGLKEMHSDIMTSTTRTELVADVPNLPEKITMLSSGVSSSSEDTVRLKSGKIHIITSNMQATPESQHAKILTAVQVQSGEGLAFQSEVDEAPSWILQDAQSTTRTVKHLVQETTTERSENKETLVITKQITHIFGPTEPISGDTASSIQRLKDSVHSEKMRFFEEAEK